jgi:Holliday junction resolvase RusA-like endonuclease
MRVSFTVPGRLPGLNEYVKAERSSKYAAAEMKKAAESRIRSCIDSQLAGAMPFAFDEPVAVSYKWVEPNRRRDKDNIAFAKKFVQDALVASGILRGDGWEHVECFEDAFAVADSPRVVVTVVALSEWLMG